MTALTSLTDGSRTGKREQTVLTGRPILDLLTAFWGRTALDPCAPPDGPITVKCGAKRKGKHPSDCKHCGGAGFTEQAYDLAPERAVRLPENGLAVSWGDRTFSNPPYDKLKDWLAVETDPADRVIWYVPSRPHRRWYRAWAATLTDLIALNPQKFKGYTCAFPAPLVLGYRGPREHVPLLRGLCASLDLGESILAPHEHWCTLDP